MRVRLKPDAAIPVKDQPRFSASIEPDKEYVVLELDGRLLRLYGDDAPVVHGLWEARYFETTDTAVPRNWTIKLDREGNVELAPHRWHEPGFWEALVDDEAPERLTWEEHVRRREDARETFDADLKIILADSI
jgi:hypothetical protein